MSAMALLDLFFPRICAACDETLNEAEKVVCTPCLHRLPVIQQQEDAEDLMKRHFYGRIPIAHGSSLLYYQKKGLSQHIIHRLKYKGDERISEFLGRWLVAELLELSWSTTVDYVIPVPLHKRRKRERGYNQVTGFGKALAQGLHCQYTEDVLIKIFDSKTQVFKNRFARTELKGAYFTLQHAERLKGKHLLLVDDIITTGTTLVTCAKILQKAQPSKISLGTMAITV